MNVPLSDTFAIALEGVMFGLVAGLMAAGFDLGPLGWAILGLIPLGMLAFLHKWDTADRTEALGLR